MRRRFTDAQRVAVARATVMGIVLGLAIFAIVAGLWQSGHVRLAETAASTFLILTLGAVAAIVGFGRPAQMRRARVPTRRALPPAWWPRDDDTTPVIALCVGVPMVMAAVAGAAIFH